MAGIERAITEMVGRVPWYRRSLQLVVGAEGRLSGHVRRQRHRLRLDGLLEVKSPLAVVELDDAMPFFAHAFADPFVAQGRTCRGFE